MNDTEFFKSISVWHRVDGEKAVLYECLESMRTGLFTVWVATSVTPSNEPIVAVPTAHFLEHFVEHDDALAEPDEQTQWFATLYDAIEAHRRDFNDEYFASEIAGYRNNFGYD